MIKVVCILPNTGAGFGLAEKILVEAIANQLEMLFLIYTSREVKKTYLKPSKTSNRAQFSAA
jgi:hypothetical protein